MGQKLLTVEGFGVLGIRMMRELLTSLDILPFSKEEVIAQITVTNNGPEFFVDERWESI